MSDLLAHLNPPQLQAVTLPPVHSLILAGAGSGKTRVLTTRIAWLMSTNQVGPHGVLAVTFTNKAAKEMTARLTALVPINTRGMWIGTFHGLCNRLLRAHYREAGLPQTFQILDSADQLAMVKRLLKNLNVDDEKYPPRELCHFINSHKEQGIRAAQAEAYDNYTQKRVELYAEYETQCNREGERVVLIVDQLQLADFHDQTRLFQFIQTRLWSTSAGSVKANAKQLLLVLISESVLYHPLAHCSYRIWADASGGRFDYRPDEFGLGLDARELFTAFAALFDALGSVPTSSEFRKLLIDALANARTAEHLRHCIFGWMEQIDRAQLFSPTLTPLVHEAVMAVNRYHGMDHIEIV